MRRIPLLLALVACGDNQDDPGARDLLERVRAADYRTWAHPPGWGSRLPTSAPHADEVDLYVNATMEDALAGGRIDSWPAGSIVVKDGFDGNGQLELIAVMEKRADGWFFAEYTGDDLDPAFSGRPGVCLDCHGEENDGIRAFPLPR